MGTAHDQSLGWRINLRAKGLQGSLGIDAVSGQDRDGHRGRQPAMCQRKERPTKAADCSWTGSLWSSLTSTAISLETAKLLSEVGRHAVRVTMLSGGVGGAKLARGFAALPDHELTVIANVGDDDRIYGLAVSPDIDTIIYTMAGREGPHGWGLADDPFAAMKALDRSADRHDIPDRRQRPCHQPVSHGSSSCGVVADLGDDRAGLGLWDRGHHPARDRRPAADRSPDSPVKAGSPSRSISYFRRHADEVSDVRFRGAGFCRPAPGVMEALAGRAT